MAKAVSGKGPAAFQKYVCWHTDRVSEVLAREALVPSTEFFLATHSPITDFDITKSETRIDAPTDEAFLRAITAKDVKHVFAVVRGSPGSGKSHLIRWMKYRLEDRNEKDHIVLVERRDGSLRSTLIRIVEQLEDQDHGDLLKDIRAAAGRLSEKGRAQEFLDKLAILLDPELVNESFDGHQECKKLGLSSLLRDEAVRRSLLSNSGAATRITQRITGTGKLRERPDGTLEEFTLDDVDRIASIPTKDLGPAVKKAAATLRDEKTQMRMVEIINRRLPSVIETLLHLQHDQLVTLFEEIRKRLFPNRLILLIEDITCFQGIDNQLLEVLIHRETGAKRSKRPMCTLVAVVGITHGYYQSHIVRQKNILDRITHEICLTSPDENEAAGGGRVRGFDSEDGVAAFASRYLNALRSEEGELESWAEGLGRAGSGKVPNACGNCPRHLKDPCQSAFGTGTDGVGLYPFNARALWKLYQGLEDPNEGSMRNPRGIIKDILVPVLEQARHMKEEPFPTLDVVRYEAPPALTLEAEGFLERQARKQRDELMTVLRVWGDGTVSLSKGADGAVRLGQVPRGLFDAWGLPWLGEKLLGHGPVLPPPPVVPVDPESGSGSDKRNLELERRHREVSAWFDPKKPKPLESAETWRRMVHEFLSSAVDWEAEGVSRAVREVFFTPAYVRIDGQQLDSSDWSYKVPREKLTRDLLLALASYEHVGKKSWQYDSGGDQEAAFRFLRAHGSRVVKQVRKLSQGGTSKPWQPSVLAMELLVLDGVLNGRISPVRTSPTDAYFIAMGRKDVADISLEGRPESWQKLAGSLGNGVQKLRDSVRNQFSRPTRKDEDFMDAGVLYRAITRFLETFRLSPVPDKLPLWSGQPLRDPLAAFVICALRNAAESAMDQVLSDSRAGVARQLDKLGGILRGQGLPGYVKAVNDLLLAVKQHLHPTGGAQIQAWERADSRSSSTFRGERAWNTAKIVAILERVRDLTPDEGRSVSFQACLALPASDLASAALLVDAGTNLAGIAALECSKRRAAAGAPSKQEIQKEAGLVRASLERMLVDLRSSGGMGGEG